MGQVAVNRIQNFPNCSQTVSTNNFLTVVYEEMRIVCLPETAKQIDAEPVGFTNFYAAIDVHNGESRFYRSIMQEVSRFVHHIEEGVVLESTMDVGIKRCLIGQPQMQFHIRNHTDPYLIGILKKHIHTQAGASV